MATSTILRSIAASSLVVLTAVLAAAPAVASGELDQGATFDGTGNSDEVFVNGSIPQRLSQSFTAGVTGTLTSVDVGISQTNSPANLTIEIFDAVGDVPTATLLATRTLSGADLSAVTTGQVMVPVAFTTPTSVTAGATYAIVASTTSVLPAKFNWYWAAPYSRGSAAYDDGTNGWNTLPYDVTFATYVIAVRVFDQAAPASPAAVLQQFGKPATGTCDEAAPANLSISGVDAGGWSESWGRWDGYEGPVCTRTLEYSTSLNSWIVG